MTSKLARAQYTCNGPLYFAVLEMIRLDVGGCCRSFTDAGRSEETGPTSSEYGGKGVFSPSVR